MRITWVVALAGYFVTILALPVAGAEPPDQTAGNTAAMDDPAIISIAIQHFSEQKVIWAFTGRESKKLILIHNESSGPSAIYLSDSQLRSDLKQENWEVPSELSHNLRLRNAKAVPLSNLRLGKGILVAVLEQVPPQLDKREPPKVYAQAKAYAYVWLPAYSKDSATAVFRFSFGPTPHGATATYLLSKRDGVWKVVKWALAYYA